jgi:hypothetical protein
MKKFEVFLLTTTFNLLLFGLYFAYTNPTYFSDVYAREDGLIESLSALILFLGAAVCFYRVLKLRKIRSRLFLGCTALLGVLFLFGAGEEISWGQRIFNVESPEFFQSHNSQQETNLHNLIVGEVRINKLVFGKILAVVIVSYLLVLPLLHRKNFRIREWVDRMAIPVPRYYHILFYLALFIIVLLTPSKRKGELLEFGGCALFFLIILFPVNEKIFQPATPDENQNRNWHNPRQTRSLPRETRPLDR